MSYILNQDKNAFAKLVITIALVFSFFAFSGFIHPAVTKPCSTNAMPCCARKSVKVYNFIKAAKRLDTKHRAGIFLISPFLGFNNLHNLPAAPVPAHNAAYVNSPEIGFIYRARSVTSNTDEQPANIR